MARVAVPMLAIRRKERSRPKSEPFRLRSLRFNDEFGPIIQTERHQRAVVRTETIAP